MGEAGTKRACEIGPQADLALVLDTSENMALGQGGSLQGGLRLKVRIPFMMVHVVKRFMLAEVYLVQVQLKND